MRIDRFVPSALMTCLGLATALAGCSNDPENGNLSVLYDFGPGGTCESEGVVNVRVVLGNDEVTEEEPCSDGGEVLLSGVDAGNYEILVLGLDDVGDAVRDNLAEPGDDEVVEVVGGQSREHEVRLSPTPAIIQYRFSILDADGFVLLPAGSEIQFFDTTAFFNQLPMTVSHQFVYADYPGNFVPVPDENREIFGDFLNAVTVDLLDSAQSEVDSVDITFNPPGAGKTIQFTITCMADTCSGEVTAGAGTTTEPMTTGVDESSGGAESSTGGADSGGSGG